MQNGKRKRKWNNESMEIRSWKRKKFNNNTYKTTTNGFIPELLEENKEIRLDLLEFFKEFHSDICSEKEVLRKSLKKCLNLLQENHQNVRRTIF